MENVIEKIKDIRKEKGYSHEYMAHMLDISQVAYSKIEKQETKLSVERLFKIAEILETLFQTFKYKKETTPFFLYSKILF
uniref:helix-turn-helix domain-containing protein n=1 Tax=Flavobacterium sp. TaxID=239 RepID=UPI00404888C5